MTFKQGFPVYLIYFVFKYIVIEKCIITFGYWFVLWLAIDPEIFKDKKFQYIDSKYITIYLKQLINSIEFTKNMSRSVGDEPTTHVGY